MDDEHGGEYIYGYTLDMDDEYGGYGGTIYTECALCSTPGDEEYCNEGCPKEALDLLGEYHERVITRDEYLERVMIRNNIIRNSNKEISTLASENAVKNIDADSSKNSCKNTDDTARSSLKVTAENKMNHDELETTKSEETVAECAVDPS